MSINWGSLLAVFVVSVGSAVAVVTLVTLWLAGLSVPATPAATIATAGTAEIGVPTRRWVLPAPSCRATLALLSLSAAAAIVLLGLWVILDK